MKFKDSLDDYDRLIKEMKDIDLPIDVSFGLEVCYVPKYKEYIRNILKIMNMILLWAQFIQLMENYMI